MAGDERRLGGAPLYGGLVSDRLPEARIVLADSSGAVPTSVVSQLAGPWGSATPSPTGRHDPDITFASASPRGDLLATIDANEAQIEAGGVNQASFTAAGDDVRRTGCQAG